MLLFLLNLLAPQRLWINFKPTSISGWIIHGNVQALNLGRHPFPYSQLHAGWSPEMSKNQSPVTDSYHPEMNFIFSIPLLSLSEFNIKGRNLCSLLDFKEWKIPSYSIFLMHRYPWFSAPLLYIIIFMSSLKCFSIKSRINLIRVSIKLLYKNLWTERAV